MRRCAMHCPHTDTRAPAWLNWMAAWIDGWMDACMHACMHAWLHGCMGGRTDGRTDRCCMDAQMDTRMGAGSGASLHMRMHARWMGWDGDGMGLGAGLPDLTRSCARLQVRARGASSRTRSPRCEWKVQGTSITTLQCIHTCMRCCRRLYEEVVASAKRVAAAAERIEKHRAPQHMLLGINDAWQL